MKILVISDVHDREEVAEIACNRERPDLVLDCGDRSSLVNVSGLTPHYYVRGNHEPLEVRFNENSYPLPHKIDPRQIYHFSAGKEKLRFSGLGGNFSFKEPLFAITERDVGFLKKMSPGSLDVLLLHESPFNDSISAGRSADVAEAIVGEIDRINPRFVFSGHIGHYREAQTPGGVRIYSLDDIGGGYGILDVSEDRMSFNRVICRFAGEDSKRKRLVG